MRDTEVYPGAGSGGWYGRTGVARIQRIQAVLAIERAAYDAGWGALTRYPPLQYRPEHYNARRAKADPPPQSGSGSFGREIAGELSGIHSELRELRREVSALRSASAFPARAASGGSGAGMGGATYMQARDFVGETTKVQPQKAAASYLAYGATVGIGQRLDRPL